MYCKLLFKNDFVIIESFKIRVKIICSDKNLFSYGYIYKPVNDRLSYILFFFCIENVFLLTPKKRWFQILINITNMSAIKEMFSNTCERDWTPRSFALGSWVEVSYCWNLNQPSTRYLSNKYRVKNLDPEWRWVYIWF